MLNNIKNSVYTLLEKEDSGHGFDHVIRVYNLALKFAEIEGADKYTVGIAALLHDVDDYKLVGVLEAENLSNAKMIMNNNSVPLDIQSKILNIINTMGYSKLLKGIRPQSLEGMVVSDADMCDAIGATGIIRSILYTASSKGNGIVFDKNILPNINITAEEYNNQGTTYDTDNAINHFFEKLLKLNNLMMTSSGKNESCLRQKIMIDFLYQFFREENALEWSKFLDDYLVELNDKSLVRSYTKNV